jgi:hypothetical protein
MVSFQLWHIPVLVAASIIVLEFVGHLVLGRRPTASWIRYIPVALYSAIGLGGLVLIMFLLANWDSSITGNIIALATLLIEIVGIYLLRQQIKAVKSPSP